MNEFDIWFKKNFYQLHELCCINDTIAMQYKKAMKKAWTHKAKKINLVLKFIDDKKINYDENREAFELVEQIKNMLK